MGPLAVGRIVERYRVEEHLGEGGTAVVYRVRHVHLGTDHALKVMTLIGAQAGPRLLLEGKVQAALRHPNIVAVTDVLDVDGSYGLLMEYVPPPSLAHWIARNPVRVEIAEELFRGIVEGVRHAHAHGLVHRDLKPANVLLARAEGRGLSGLVPKVSDFGLARLLDEDGDRHTRSGLAMGTPQYMAPEQFRDAKSVDRRADLFSLGCILQELLSGMPAFEWTDMIGVYDAMVHRRSAPLDGMPARLRTAVAACLEPDRDKRVPDCATLLAILDGTPRAPTLVPSAEGRAWLEEGAARIGLPAGGAADETFVADTPAKRVPPEAPTVLDRALPTLPPPPRRPEAAPLTDAPPTLLQPDAPGGETLSGEALFDPPKSRPRGLAVLLTVGIAGLLVAGAFVVTRNAPDPAPLVEPKPYATTGDVPPDAPPVVTGAASQAGTDHPAGPDALPLPPKGEIAPPPKVTAKPGKAAKPDAHPAASEPTREATTPPPNPTVEPVKPAPPVVKAPDAPPVGTQARARGSGARAVMLEGPDGKVVLPAQVSPGSWQVWADFGSGFVDAGKATLSAGDDVEIKCNAGFTQCTVRR